MTRLVGLSKAAELILTGERVTAEEALRIGLVGRVVPAAGLLKEAETLAAAIATRGRIATRAALRAIRGGCDRPVSEGLVRESELFGELCETQDKNEGIQAFLEKRPPHFADTDP
jgi:enoyl-CoA hydratase/carnithine racemase